MSTIRRFCWCIAIAALVSATGCGGGVATTGEDSIYAQAAKGEIPPVRYALEQGFDVNTPDESGKTLLHHAVAANQAAVVEMLIVSFQANPARKDQSGQNPVELALALNDPAVVEVLYNEGFITY